MLKINNLHVSVGDKPILKGLTLDVPAGEVHAIMGPNGAGKSTLGYALSGRPGYEATEGAVEWAGEDLLALEPAERAAKGVFLSFQYPIEIPGVPALTFVRTALNAQRRARGEEEVSAPEFLRLVKAASKALKMDFDMLKRPLNVGFSGGEKKRMEILQMALLEPGLSETVCATLLDVMREAMDEVVSRGVPAEAARDIARLRRIAGEGEDGPRRDARLHFVNDRGRLLAILRIGQRAGFTLRLDRRQLVGALLQQSVDFTFKPSLLRE